MRRAFTLIELVVVIAIIAILVALIAVAVQAARGRARATNCISNLKQIGLALQHYEAVHKMFPAGSSRGKSFHVALLPYIEQDEQLGETPEIVIPIYMCPADSAPVRIEVSGRDVAGTNYLGNYGVWPISHGSNGMFRYWEKIGDIGRGPVRLSEVSNGTGFVIAVSESYRADRSHDRLRVNWNTPTSYNASTQLEEFAGVCRALPLDPEQFGWLGATHSRGTPWTQAGLSITMYDHLLTPNEPSCYNGNDVLTAAVTASSAHGSGVHSLFVDGHVEFIDDNIEADIWRNFGSRIKSDRGE